MIKHRPETLLKQKLAREEPESERREEVIQAQEREHDEPTEATQSTKETLMMNKPTPEDIAAIDPEIAEITWWWGQTLDPYGLDPDLPPEYQEVQRNYFARAPGSDVWVSFYDLPEDVGAALWKKAGEAA